MTAINNPTSIEVIFRLMCLFQTVLFVQNKVMYKASYSMTDLVWTLFWGIIVGKKHPCLYMPGHTPGTAVNELSKQPGASPQEAHSPEEKSSTKEAAINGKTPRQVLGRYRGPPNPVLRKLRCACESLVKIQIPVE